MKLAITATAYPQMVHDVDFLVTHAPTEIHSLIPFFTRHKRSNLNAGTLPKQPVIATAILGDNDGNFPLSSLFLPFFESKNGT